ncbi:PKD-like domain-containing protein, partial [Lutibacter holmesii]
MSKNYPIKKSLQIVSAFFEAFNIKRSYFSFVFTLGLFLVSFVASSQTASFTADVSAGCSPIAVVFTDTSTEVVGNEIVSWAWDLGNSNTSTFQNPSANYPEPGLYTVSLTVTYDDGSTSSTSQEISSYPAPSVSLNAAFEGCEPYTATLQPVSSPITVPAIPSGSLYPSGVGEITGGDIVSYEWNFFGFLPTQTTTVGSPDLTLTNIPYGSYDVYLTAYDEYGCSTSVFVQKAVVVNAKPEVSFTYLKGDPCGTGNVDFDGEGVIESGSIASYEWFIDGASTANTEDFSYNFTAAGDYSIQLIATSDNGCVSDPVTQIISFNNNNTTDFSFSFNASGGNCNGEAVSFTNTSNGSSYVWDFGDGNSSTDVNPSHSFGAPGDYTVTLTSTFSDGCTIPITKTVEVSGATADFTFGTGNACNPDYTANFDSSTSTAVGTTITGYAWDFGDGNASVDPNPGHDYGAPGSYTVNLTVTTANGCENTTEQTVVIEPTEIDFSADSLELEGCNPVSTTFTAIYPHSSDTIATYLWTFSDGTTSTDASPTHSFSGAGEYDVSLEVTTVNGCTLSTSESDYVQVGERQVISDVQYSQLNFCRTSNVIFTADFTDLVDEVVWIFDSGTGSAYSETQYVNNVTSSSISHRFSDPDVDHSVTVIVYYNGCPSLPYTVDNIVIDEPEARFEFTPTTACDVPTTVTFTNTSKSTVNVSTYEWDFGDGTPLVTIVGDDSPINHTYTTAGDFTVSLTVRNSATDCDDRIREDIRVTTSTPLFSVDNQIVCAGSPSVFTNLVAANSSSNFVPATYEWDFGNGDTSTDENPTYTYNTPGLYTVTLKVIEQNGCEYTHEEINYMTVNGPIVAFDADPIQICLGTEVNFTDLTTKAPTDDSTSFTYLWEFGDGNSSTAQNPTHTYTANGGYTVTLTVTDNNGCSASISKSDNVVVPPVTAGFTTTRDNYCIEDNTVVFTDTAVGNGLTYEWDFGDGNGFVAGTSAASFTYAATGTYTVIQRVTSDLGCIDEFSKDISIVDDVADILIPDTDLGCAPGLAQFSTTDTDNVVASYSWDFGDGYISTDKDPDHYYILPGTYTATLTETLIGGCTRTSSVEIFVDGAIGEFSFDSTLGCAPHTVNFTVEGLEGVEKVTWDFGDGTTEVEDNIGTKTSATVSHTYSSYGSRLPTVILTNSTCGDYAYTYQSDTRINTTEAPNANFNISSIDTGLDCENKSIQFTDTSTLNDPRYPISKWLWDFGDGTTSTQQNPMHTYTSAGAYIVSLIVDNGVIDESDGGCPAAVTQEILIRQLPIAVATPDTQTICDGTSSADIVLSTSNSIDFTTFAWTRDKPAGISGPPVSGAGDITGAVFNNSTADPITVTYTIIPTGPAPTYCEGDSITAEITVNPTPKVNSASTNLICNGESVNYDITSLTAGTTFTWTASEITAPTGGAITGFTASGSGADIDDTLVNSGSSIGVVRYVITPTGPASTNCPGEVFNYDVTVNPIPDVIATPATQIICSEETTSITLSSNTTGTEAVTYSWTAAVISGSNTTGFSDASGATIAQTLTNNGTTQAVVQYTITPAIGSCIGVAETVNVTVNPSGQVNNPGNQRVCNNNSTAEVIFDTLNTDGTTTYEWTNSNTSIGLAAASGTGNIPSFTAVNTGTSQAVAVFTITPTYTNGGISCEGLAMQFRIRVNPTGQVDQPADEVFCNGTENTLNFTTVNEIVDGTTTYAWTGGTSIGLADGSVNSVASGNTGPTFTATNSTTAPIVATITVIPTYTRGGVGCPGPSKSFTITVNPSGQVNALSDQVVCNGGATSLVTFSTNNTGGTTTYTWDNDTESIGLLDGSGPTIDSFTAVNTTTAPIVATITVTPTFTNDGVSCEGTTQEFTITVNPTGQVNPIAAQTFCNEDSPSEVTFSTNNTGGTTTYSWTNTNEDIGLGGSGTGNLSFTASNTTNAPIIGTIEVTPTFENGGVSCTGPSESFTITINPKGQINDPTDEIICSNTSTNIALSTTVPGTTFYYDAPTISGAAGNITGGTARLTPGNISNITDTLVNTTADIQTATYTVYPIYDGCIGTSEEVVVTVNPTPKVSSASTKNICDNTAVGYTITSETVGTTYTWTASVLTTPAGGTISGFTTSGVGANIDDTLVNTGTSPGVVRYVITPTGPASTNCPGEVFNFDVTVHPTPKVSSVAANTICNNTAVGYTITSDTAGTTFTWTSSVTTAPTSGTITGFNNDATGSNTQINDVLLNNGTSPGVVTYVITPTGPTGCPGEPFNFEVTVNPSGQINTISNQELCNGDATSSVSFSTNNTGGTTTYTWDNDTESIGLLDGSGSTIPSFTAINSTAAPIVATITVTPTFTNDGVSCEGTAEEFTITVNPTPKVSSAAANTICNNTAVGYTITSDTAGTTFTWTASVLTAPTGGTITGFNNDATGSNTQINDVLVNTGTSPGVVRYVITPTGPASTNCPGEVFNFDVTVNPTAQVNPISNQTLCSGDDTSLVTFSTNNSGGTTTYTWTNTNEDIGLGANGSGPTIDPFTSTNSTTSPISGTITVTPTFTNNGVSCIGPSTDFTITVEPVPVLTSGLTEDLCVDTVSSQATSNLTLTTNPNMAGVLFEYEAPTLTGGMTGGSARTTPSSDPITDTFTNNTPDVQTATYLVTPIAPSGLSCEGVQETVVITVYPIITITSSLTDQVCSGEEFSYTITSNVSNSDFSWSRAAVAGISNASATGTGSSIEETLVNTTGNPIDVAYVLTPTGPTGCLGVESTLVVTVNPTPAVTVGLNQAICSGTNANLVLTTTPSVAGTTFTWPAPTTEGSFGTVTGGTARIVGSTSPITDNLVNTTNAPLTLVYLVTPTSSLGCIGTPEEVKITVYPIPTINSDATKEICNNTSVAYSPTSAAASSFTWTASLTSGNVTGFNTNSGTTINDVLENTGTTIGTVTYTITPTGVYPANCMGTPFDFVVTVNPTPDVVATPTSEEICSGDTTSIALSTNVTGSTVTYDWTATVISGSASGFSNDSGNTIAETLVNSGTTQAVVQYTITPSIGMCEGSPITVDVTVNPSPTFSVSTPVQGTCASPLGSLELTDLPSGNWTITQTGTASNTYAGSGSTYTVSGLASGTYNFTVTNDDGCTSAISSDVVIDNIICAIVDDFTSSPVDEVTGGTAGDVTANDTLNGILVTDTDITITLDDNDGISGLTIDANGNIIVPAGTSEGTYTIDYTICEIANTSNCSSNSATIVVDDAGDPIAVNDPDSGTYLVDEDSSSNTLDWITNDTIIDGAALASFDTATSNGGTVTDNGDGTFDYVPAAGYVGLDQFEYTICDNDSPTASCSTATVFIEVENVNDAPVATDDSFSGQEDTTITGNIITDGNGNGADYDIDLDALSVDQFIISGAPGTVYSIAPGSDNSATIIGVGTITIASDGALTFVPANDYFGPVPQILYRLTDGALTDTAIITITITPVNDAPVADANATTTVEDVPVTFNVTSTDTDIDGTINSATVDLDPTTIALDNSITTADGTWTVDNNGDVTFSPVLAFVGTASLSYVVYDNQGLVSNEANLSVVVSDEGDPVAVADSGTTLINTTLTTVNVLLNDTVVDSATITSFDNTSVEGGTVTNNGDGTFNYVPATDFVGTDTFTYTLCDDDSPASCSTAIVTITIPEASELVVTKLASTLMPNVGEHMTFTISVLNNGPSDATSIELLDVLPSGYSYVSDDGAGAYNAASGLWSIASLADGVTTSLTITALVNASGDYT